MINFRSRRGSVLDTHPHTIKQPLSESDVSQVDVSRQHREVALRDSMHRNFEIGQRDDLGRPLESLPPYAYQRRNETTTQEISRRGSVLDTNPHSITSSRSKNHPVTIKQPLSESDDDDDNENIVLKILTMSTSLPRRSEDSLQWSPSPPPAAPRGAYDGSGGLSTSLPRRSEDSLQWGSHNPVNSFKPDDYSHNRLEAVKQISGVRVIVHEPHLGTSDRIIAISGTPNQTKTAQRLLHALILIGESVSLLERLGLHCTQTFS